MLLSRWLQLVMEMCSLNPMEVEYLEPLFVCGECFLCLCLSLQSLLHLSSPTHRKILICFFKDLYLKNNFEKKLLLLSAQCISTTLKSEFWNTDQKKKVSQSEKVEDWTKQNKTSKDIFFDSKRRKLRWDNSITQQKLLFCPKVLIIFLKWLTHFEKIKWTWSKNRTKSIT